MNFLKPYYYRFLKLKNRILQGKPVLVLMYHRIDDHSHAGLSKLTVSPQSFEEQLNYFSQRYQPLRLTGNWSGKRKTGVVLTFDDGYAESLFAALPAMERYNIPATLFITTQNIGTDKEFWWDRLAWDLDHCGDWFFHPDQNVKVSKKEYGYKFLSGFLLKFKNDEKDRWLLRFENANNLVFMTRNAYRVLSEKALQKLARHPLIDIGLHTHHHYALGDLTAEAQKQELALSVTALNEWVPEHCNFLAVPYGSSNAETKGIAESLGINGILLANDNYSNAENKKSKKINRILMPDIKGEALKNYLKKFEFGFW